MKRVLAVIVAALALPAAAQAKEINGLAVCGPNSCEDVDMAGFGHRDPIAGDSATDAGPPPSDFLRVDFTVDGQRGAFQVFYEPRSGLVATILPRGHVEWARLAPGIAGAVKEAAKRVQPFPAPRVTGARIGARVMKGDPSSYLSLLTIEGADVVPKTAIGSRAVTLEAAAPNPWTEIALLYYPQDDVLLRGSTFVKLPADLAADIEAARLLGPGEPEPGGTSVPWLPIGVALGGALLLVALFLRAKATRRRALVAASVLALAVPAGAGAKGLTGASLCGSNECRDVAVTGLNREGPFSPGDSRSAPAPGPYYELKLAFEHGGDSRGIYYEPRSGLAAYSEEFGSTAWAPLRGGWAKAVQRTAEDVEPYPTPRITAAWVGGRRVSGAPATYLRLFGLKGPFVVPSTSAGLEWIRLDSPTANPWTENPIAYYPADDVVLASWSTYLRVPASVAAALESARPLDGERRTTIPWLAVAVALGGVVVLLAVSVPPVQRRIRVIQSA